MTNTAGRRLAVEDGEALRQGHRLRAEILVHDGVGAQRAHLAELEGGLLFAVAHDHDALRLGLGRESGSPEQRRWRVDKAENKVRRRMRNPPISIGAAGPASRREKPRFGRASSSISASPPAFRRKSLAVFARGTGRGPILALELCQPSPNKWLVVVGARTPERLRSSLESRARQWRRISRLCFFEIISRGRRCGSARRPKPLSDSVKVDGLLVVGGDGVELELLALAQVATVGRHRS